MGGQDSEWAAWFEGALEAAGETAAGLSQRSQGRFERATVSKWRSGTLVPSAESAAEVAVLLKADPAGALRAAGYGLLAGLVEGKQPDGQ